MLTAEFENSFLLHREEKRRCKKYTHKKTQHSALVARIWLVMLCRGHRD